MEEAEDSSPIDQNTSSIISSKEVEDSSLMNIIPMEEAEDYSPMNPSIFKQSLVRKQNILTQSTPSVSNTPKKNPQRGSRRLFLNVLSKPWRKQKILPQWITHLCYFLASPLLLLRIEFLIPKQIMRGRRFLPMHIYSPMSFRLSQWITDLHYSLASLFLLLLSTSFSYPSKSWEAEDSSLCTSTAQWVFTISSGSNNQDYSCTYPLGVEHASTVEKGRDNDREKDQGQPEARTLTKRVEKEVKKARGTSCSEKFKARASNGHHRDYILLFFVGLARKSTLVCFLFPFLVTQG